MVCAAFFARVRPVSTSANPACMNITRKPATIVHTMLRAVWVSVSCFAISAIVGSATVSPVEIRLVGVFCRVNAPALHFAWLAASVPIADRAVSQHPAQGSTGPLTGSRASRGADPGKQDARLVRGDYSWIWAPISTTRFGGRPKKALAGWALRDITMKSRLRQPARREE